MRGKNRDALARVMARNPSGGFYFKYGFFGTLMETKPPGARWGGTS